MIIRGCEVAFGLSVVDCKEFLLSIVVAILGLKSCSLSLKMLYLFGLIWNEKSISSRQSQIAKQLVFRDC